MKSMANAMQVTVARMNHLAKVFKSRLLGEAVWAGKAVWAGEELSLGSITRIPPKMTNCLRKYLSNRTQYKLHSILIVSA